MLLTFSRGVMQPVDPPECRHALRHSSSDSKTVCKATRPFSSHGWPTSQRSDRNRHGAQLSWISSRERGRCDWAHDLGTSLQEAFWRAFKFRVAEATAFIASTYEGLPFRRGTSLASSTTRVAASRDLGLHARHWLQSHGRVGIVPAS